ncbi:MAG: hypothetical protein D6696_03285 [Acidobacteria bacterium]|nr:MAG: hypothetical protein D6696_03285 [Acidobacteriota bacterium]
MDEILERLDALHTGLAKLHEYVEGRFNTVEGRFDTVEGRFDTIERSVAQRFDRLEAQIRDVQKAILVISPEVRKLKQAAGG